MTFTQSDVDARVFFATRNRTVVQRERFKVSPTKEQDEYDGATEQNLRFIRGRAQLPTGISKERQLQIAISAFNQIHERKAS